MLPMLPPAPAAAGLSSSCGQNRPTATTTTTTAMATPASAGTLARPAHTPNHAMAASPQLAPGARSARQDQGTGPSPGTSRRRVMFSSFPLPSRFQHSVCAMAAGATHRRDDLQAEVRPGLDDGGGAHAQVELALHVVVQRLVLRRRTQQLVPAWRAGMCGLLVGGCCREQGERQRPLVQARTTGCARRPRGPATRCTQSPSR